MRQAYQLDEFVRSCHPAPSSLWRHGKGMIIGSVVSQSHLGEEWNQWPEKYWGHPTQEWSTLGAMSRRDASFELGQPCDSLPVAFV